MFDVVPDVVGTEKVKKVDSDEVVDLLEPVIDDGFDAGFNLADSEDEEV